MKIFVISYYFPSAVYISCKLCFLFNSHLYYVYSTEGPAAVQVSSFWWQSNLLKPLGLNEIQMGPQYTCYGHPEISFGERSLQTSWATWVCYQWSAPALCKGDCVRETSHRALLLAVPGGVGGRKYKLKFLTSRVALWQKIEKFISI